MPKMTIISGCDGDIGQIADTLGEQVAAKDRLFKIIWNKYSPKRTGSVAIVGFKKMIKSIKGVLEVIIMKNSPVSVMPASVNKAIDLDERVNLKTNNEIIFYFCRQAQ